MPNRRRRCGGTEGRRWCCWGWPSPGFWRCSPWPSTGGNALVQRRRAQNAADAAALAGARRLWEIRRAGGSEADLIAALQQAIDAHGAFNVEGQPNRFEAVYVDEQGNPLGPVGGGIPGNARGVRVTVINRFDAFFAGVFGFDPMEVRALAAAVYRQAPACAFALFAEGALQAKFALLSVGGGVHAGTDLTLRWAGRIEGPCEYGAHADIALGIICAGGQVPAPFQPLPALYAPGDFAPGGPLWNAYAGDRYCLIPEDPHQPVVLDAHPAGTVDPLNGRCLTVQGGQRVRLRDGLVYVGGDARVIRSQGRATIRATLTLATTGVLRLDDPDNAYELVPALRDPPHGAPLLVAGGAITITTPSQWQWEGLIFAEGGPVALSAPIAWSDRGAIYGRALELKGGQLKLRFDPSVCPPVGARVELLR